jgi:hypothetical protein
MSDRDRDVYLESGWEDGVERRGERKGASSQEVAQTTLALCPDVFAKRNTVENLALQNSGILFNFEQKD